MFCLTSSSSAYKRWLLVVSVEIENSFYIGVCLNCLNVCLLSYASCNGALFLNEGPICVSDTHIVCSYDVLNEIRQDATSGEVSI